MQLGYALISLLMLLSFCGCSKHQSPSEDIDLIVKRLVVPEKYVLAITNGSSLLAVKNALGTAVFHEFTIAETNGDYTLMGCRVSPEDSSDLWLLFHSNILTKIIEPTSAEVEKYPYQGTTATRIRRWDIDDIGRITKIIESPALTREQIVAEVEKLDSTNHKVGRTTVGDEMGNMVWASVIRDFNAKMAPRMKKDYEINQELLKRYDGSLVVVGMETDEVVKLYGKPQRVFSTKHMETVRVFGDDRELEVNPAHLFSWVAVVFDAQGRVTSVCSRDFFCDDWKKSIGQ
jgi:hypothetical protein